jgi:hypothetical protein
MGFVKKMLMGDQHYHRHGYQGGYYFKLFRIGKDIVVGNISFLAISSVLLLFFLITGLADVYNGLPVSKWLDTAMKFLQGIPVSNIVNYTSAEKLLTEAQNIPPVDILTPAQQFFTVIVSLLKALTDEIVGFVLLIVAFALKVSNQYAGKPSVSMAWLMLAVSPLAAVIEYL